MTPTANTRATYGPVTAIGRSIFTAAEASGDGILLMLRALRYLPMGAWRRRGEIWTQMLICGVYSLPVALLVGAFSGMVIALQVGLALVDWDMAERIGAVTPDAMCRELGPIWVGVILAARVGSAMAAELGTMRVTEEIDALEVMSIDPARFLVLPRLIALTIMAPMLTAYADLVGTLGGAVVGKYQLGVSYGKYFYWVRRTLSASDILPGLLIKAPIYGLTIAVVGCTLGLRVKPAEGAEGVGAATRNSVVVALILLIVLNYFLSSVIRYI